MSTQDDSIHTETPQHEKTDAVRVGSREMVGRLLIGLRWTWRWSVFKNDVLRHTENPVENAIIEVFVWLSLGLMSVLSFPILITARLAMYLIGPFVGPFVREKAFYDMLERRLASDREKSPNKVGNTNCNP